MAQRKRTKKKKTRSSGGGQRASAAARRKRQKAREAQALKSMALGGLIIALLCVVFFVPIGGKTIFNHLFEPDPEAEATTPATDGSATRKPAGVPVKPKRIQLNPAANKAPPMEKVTDREQKSLDDLIDSKSKK